MSLLKDYRRYGGDQGGLESSIRVGGKYLDL